MDSIDYHLKGCMEGGFQKITTSGRNAWGDLGMFVVIKEYQTWQLWVRVSISMGSGVCGGDIGRLEKSCLKPTWGCAGLKMRVKLGFKKKLRGWITTPTFTVSGAISQAGSRKVAGVDSLTFAPFLLISSVALKTLTWFPNHGTYF